MHALLCCLNTLNNTFASIAACCVSALNLTSLTILLFKCTAINGNDDSALMLVGWYAKYVEHISC